MIKEERRIANRRQAERRSGQGAIDIYRVEIKTTLFNTGWFPVTIITFVTVENAIAWVHESVGGHWDDWRIVNRFTNEVVRRSTA